MIDSCREGFRGSDAHSSRRDEKERQISLMISFLACVCPRVRKGGSVTTTATVTHKGISPEITVKLPPACPLASSSHGQTVRCVCLSPRRNPHGQMRLLQRHQEDLRDQRLVSCRDRHSKNVRNRCCSSGSFGANSSG